jgi:hypothetical protein
MAIIVLKNTEAPGKSLNPLAQTQNGEKDEI